MANSPQSIKRARQATKRRKCNQSVNSYCRTVIKAARAAVGDSEKSEGALKNLKSTLDRTARRGLMHPNTAARLKKRINAAHRATAATAAE